MLFYLAALYFWGTHLFNVPKKGNGKSLVILVLCLSIGDSGFRVLDLVNNRFAHMTADLCAFGY